MATALLTLWPSLNSAIWGALSGLVLLSVAGPLVSWLATRGWRVGDTRKIFHTATFTCAGLVRWRVDAGALTVFGVVVTLGVLYAIWKGSSSGLFRALARPSDMPYEKRYVLFPLIGTAVGGVIAHMIAGPLAIVAYLVGGWGDAVGEPIGIRWGRQQYRVIGWQGLIATRSWEGSAAVMIASALAAGLGLHLAGQSGINVICIALVLGVAAAIIEAASPHGWDNLTLQAAIAGLTRLLVG